MPLSNIILYDPSAYAPPLDHLSHSEVPLAVQKDAKTRPNKVKSISVEDKTMASLIGCLHQLSYVCCHAVEVFNELQLRTEDVVERHKELSKRTTALFTKLPDIESEASSSLRDSEDEHAPEDTNTNASFIKSRAMTTPPLFIKSTNHNYVNTVYDLCRAPPAFWKLEKYIQDDCTRYFSDPNYFFTEWVRSELQKQEKRKYEKMLLKEEKKTKRQGRLWRKENMVSR